MPELNLNEETVRFIINTAHEFHAREDIMFPEDSETVDEGWIQQFTSDFGDDPYYQEMRNTINDLEPDQQVSLVSLMWVGRGDYSIDEWKDALAYAEDTWTKHTAEYLIGTELLADYLDEGLAQFAEEE